MGRSPLGGIAPEQPVLLAGLVDQAGRRVEHQRVEVTEVVGDIKASELADLNAWRFAAEVRVETLQNVDPGDQRLMGSTGPCSPVAVSLMVDLNCIAR